ncbi:MAG: hypothetical protein GWO02_21490 [Gammaproteobacteria bacterium]|nr:hypothetical protein [Gammaproteobacteria bacterium]
MRPRRRRTLATLFRWHRYAGLTGAVVVAIVALTGVALNHTEALSLDTRHVRIGPLLDWYGVAPPGRPVTFPAGGHRVSQLGQRLYVDTHAVAGRFPPLIGAVASGDLLVAAVRDGVVVLTPSGEIVERMGAAEGVPTDVNGIGRTAGGDIVIGTPRGRQALGPALLRWRRFEGDGTHWAQPMAVPETLRAELLEHYRGRGLTLERVLLDLHSGRILGAWGPWVWDAAAFLLAFLAATGFSMWWLTRRGHRHRATGTDGGR